MPSLIEVTSENASSMDEEYLREDDRNNMYSIYLKSDHEKLEKTQLD